MNRLGLRPSLLLAASSIALAQAAGASETIVYGYDALGRLVRVERSGGPHGGVNASYSYDCADNRRQVTVGPGVAPTPPPPPCPPPPSAPPSP